MNETTSNHTEDRVWAIHRANRKNEMAAAMKRIHNRLADNVPTAEDVLAAMQAAR